MFGAAVSECTSDSTSTSRVLLTLVALCTACVGVPPLHSTKQCDTDTTLSPVPPGAPGSSCARCVLDLCQLWHCVPVFGLVIGSRLPDLAYFMRIHFKS